MINSELGEEWAVEEILNGAALFQKLQSSALSSS
jgi:hypothetical protein